MPASAPEQSAPSPLASSPATNLHVLKLAQVGHRCLDPIACDECMRKVARFLAFEMHYDRAAARKKTIVEYQADLGADVCTLDRALELRLMTIIACWPGFPYGEPEDKDAPLERAPEVLLFPLGTSRASWSPISTGTRTELRHVALACGRGLYKFLAHPIRTLRAVDFRVRFILGWTAAMAVLTSLLFL